MVLSYFSFFVSNWNERQIIDIETIYIEKWMDGNNIYDNQRHAAQQLQLYITELNYFVARVL